MIEKPLFYFSTKSHLVALFSFLFLVVGISLWFAINLDYQNTFNRAQIILQKTSQSLEERMQRTIVASDLILQHIAESVQERRILERRPSREEWERFRRYAEGLPDVGSLWLLNNEGDLVMDSTEYPSEHFNFSEREYFKPQRDEAIASYVGPIVKGKITDKYSFTISRRISGEDGNFLGIVLVAVETDDFTNFLRNISIGKNVSLAVFRTDGALIFRQPMGDEYLGRNFEHLKLFSMPFDESPSGLFETDSSMDGIERLVAYQKMQQFPLVAATTVPIDSISQEWRTRVKNYSIIAVIALFVLASMFWLVLRSVSREDSLRSELEVLVKERTAQLVETNAGLGIEAEQRKRAEEELQKLASVVRYSSELINLATLDGRMIFLNDAGAKMLGIEPEEVEQIDIAQVIPDHLQAKVQNEILPTLMEHGEWEGDLQYRNLRTGKMTDVHAVTFTVRDRETGAPQFLANVSWDITDRKKSEEALETARNQAVDEKNRLVAVMEALPVAVAIVDERGGNIRSNDMFEALWGSPLPSAQEVSDYMAYKAWWVDTGKLVQPEEWASARAVQKGETVVGQLIEIETFDGMRKFVMNSAAPVHNAHGKIVGCAVAMQDITDVKRAELEVQHRAAELEAVFAAQDDAVLMYDIEMNVKRVNPAFFSTYGFDPVGLNLKEIIRRVSCRWLDGLPLLLEEQPTPRALRGEKVSGACFAITRPDGTDAVIQTSSGPMRLENHIAGSVTVWHDITQLKQAEDELRQSEERFRLLSETAGRLLASQDPQGIVDELCREVMTNLDCQAFFNFLVDERAGKLRLNACAGIPEEEVRKIEWLDYGVAVCGCAARDGRRIIAEDILNTPDLRTELVKSYGIQAYCCHPLMAQGRLIGTLSFGTRTRTRFSSEDLVLMGTVSDQVATAMERVKLIGALQQSRDELEARVFERTEELQRANEILRRREEEISKSRSMLQIIFDGIPDPLLMVDKSIAVRMLNRASGRYFQVTNVEEAVGRTCYQLVGGKCPSCDECEISLAVSEGKTVTWERKGLFDPERIEQITVYPVDDGASWFPGAIIRIRDITESKNMEKHLTRADRLSSLGVLAGGIAHEIRNPLAGINLFIDVLSDEEKFSRSNQELNILEEIKGNIKRIDGIIRRVLDFSRQRDMAAGWSNLDVSALIENSLKLWQTKIAREGIHLRLFVEENLFEILGDPIELQQVLTNLFQNAIEAMEKGDTLSISAQNGTLSFDTKRTAVIIRVQDSGVGIPLDQHRNIFNPFFTTKHTGTGLGLAISHRIVSRHGGGISFASVPAVGTTFVVELPATQIN
jgi:PAS domain S-box-containing protein